MGAPPVAMGVHCITCSSHLSSPGSRELGKKLDQAIFLKACFPGDPLAPHRAYLLNQHHQLEVKCSNTQA